MQLTNKKITTTEEKIAFDMYFSSLCAMQAHPGAGTKEHAKLSIEQCRDIALEMMLIRSDTVGE